ncbi:MAG: hypothetical protein AAFX94_09900, partial [Myxococcota bacterium]
FEGLCGGSARRVVDHREDGIFDYRDEEGTLDLLVEHVLGFPPGGERFAQERLTLKRVYDVQVLETPCADPDALEESLSAATPSCGLGLSKQQAISNVWSIACQSPLLSGIGL